MRDLPPVSGAIIWARQLERQLAAAMARVENVLGNGWELDADGARLAADAERFRSKLNADQMFEVCENKINPKLQNDDFNNAKILI